MNTNPLGPLGDAAIVLILIVALCLGLDAKWVLLVWLLCEFVSKIARAFVLVLDPLIALAKRNMQKS